KNPGRWFIAVNQDSTIVPSYGLVSCSGVDDDGNLKITTPGDNQVDRIFFNGAAPILGKGRGSVTNDFPAIVRFTMDGAQVPTPGAIWGTRSGSYLLSPNGTGFLILGGADNGSGVLNAVDMLVAIVSTASLAHQGDRLGQRLRRTQGPLLSLEMPIAVA